MDCSLPGSSIHGILQARILEWVAVAFSRVSSQARDQNLALLQAASLPMSYEGSPSLIFIQTQFLKVCLDELCLHVWRAIHSITHRATVSAIHRDSGIPALGSCG